MTEMFRTDAYNRTPKDVVDEFARTYWSEPRQAINLRLVDDYNYDSSIFEIVDGEATYKIEYIPGIHLISVAAYSISRL